MNGEMSMEGRYSPIVKEEMYRMHKKGTSFADIGLKYGALPERVKAIVWQREILWNEVYPKLGDNLLFNIKPNKTRITQILFFRPF